MGKKNELHTKVADAPLALAGLVVGLIITYLVFFTKKPDAAFVYRSSELNTVLLFLILSSFFTHLGTHVKLSEIKEGGLVMGGAILGGVVVPPLVIYAVLHSLNIGMTVSQQLGISLGGAATDVALSISVYRAFIASSSNKEHLSKQLYLVVTMLTMLAIGDDLGSVLVLALLHAAHVNILGLIACLAVAFTVVAVNVLPVLTGLRKSTIAWMILAIGGIASMYAAGLHAEVGGCLVILFAPEEIKHKLDSWIKGVVNILLFYFGVQATLFSVEDIQIGSVFLTTMLGGFGGKVIGITGGFLLTRYIARRRNIEIDPKYQDASVREPLLMSVFAGVNATVALIFVQSAQVPPSLGVQATLGFLATLLVALLVSQIMRIRRYVRWSAYEEMDNV